MITTLIRYILFLLLINTIATAQKIDISFEVFHANKNYKDIVQEKLDTLKQKGYSCYILENKNNLSLQCNDSHTIQEMQYNINKLQKDGISFIIIKKGNLYQKKYRTPVQLQAGYRAYHNKEYRKAHNIFLKLYKRNMGFETGYAYSLSLMKLHKYEKALDVLQKYNQAKARVLSQDIAKLYFYDLLKRKNYDRASIIVNRYHLSKKEKLEIPYIKAVDLFKKKEYESALNILGPYRNSSEKIQRLYNDILYSENIDKAWSCIEKDPLKALKLFKESCKIKKEFGCFNGMMYAYYNLKNYKISLYIAEKLYTYKSDPKLAKMALHNELALHNYTGAKVWYHRLNNTNGIVDPYLAEMLVQIDFFLQKKEYKNAEILLQKALQQYPKNSELLKQKIRIYIAKKDYFGAQKIAESILVKNPKDSDAKYIIALNAFENKNYDLCISSLNSIVLKENYQKDMFYKCKAYNDLKHEKFEKAQIHIRNITNQKIRYAFYLDLGKYLKNKNDKRALDAYQKAKQLDVKNIESELTYLFALKDFHQEKKLDKELQYAYQNFPEEKKKLDKFQINYKKEKLYNLYRNKKYKSCYKYGKQIALKLKDKDIFSISGWCAYSLNDFVAARTEFLKAIGNTEATNQELYAYALVSARLNKRTDALVALHRIKNISTFKEKLQVIQLYTSLQDQQHAKEIAKSIKDESLKKEAFQNINKSYTNLLYENSVSAGFYWQSQIGESGLSAFDKYVIPINYNYFSLNHSLHFYINADIMHLSNGNLKNKESFKRYGFGTYEQENTLGSESVIIPKVGIDYNQYHFMIGTTPLGAKISPEPTALLSTYFVKDKWLTTIKFEQKELDETMLSYVGERAQESRKKRFWGRVLKRGATLGLNYNTIFNLSLNISYFPTIFGKNIKSNSEKKAVTTAIYYPAVKSLDYLQVGVIGIYDSYKKNENLFTYGHGGYFSPQKFFMTGIFTEFGDHFNNNFYYKSKLGIGFESYSVNDVKKFPLNDGVVNSNEVVKGYDENGFDYKFAFQVGYKINKKLDLISGVSFENFQNYTIHEIGFALVYRFDKHYNDFNTFYLNHRIDTIIPRYEVAK